MSRLKLYTFFNFSHFPTLIIAIGYIIFWIELYLFKANRGITSPLAWALVIISFALIAYLNRYILKDAIKWFFREYRECRVFLKVILGSSFLLIAVIFIVVFLALLLPPHQLPELDVINYHMSIPRQHLIFGSFRHIAWSSNDLFLLPIQFALAPYWFIQDLPNKFVQIFFIIGLISISVSLVRRFSGNRFWAICLIILAIFGSHGLGIQMPTAMLDIPICYLFLAFIDSLIRKNVIIAAIELSFLVWSKPSLALQIPVLLLTVFALTWISKKTEFKPVVSFEPLTTITIDRKLVFRTSSFFLLISLFIAGPFIGKSLYYAHTPLFPFFPGSIQVSNIDKASLHWGSLVESAQCQILGARSYGSGTSLLSFLRHLWLIAVPEESVNNHFDYPIGLPYLLMLGPFVYFLFTSFRKKVFPILPVCVVLYWGMWWFSAQQARFLFIPLLLMFISVSAILKDISRILAVCLLAALLLNALSIVRFNYKDIKKSRFLTAPIEVVRPTDRVLFERSREYIAHRETNEVALSDYYITFAQFPVRVTKKCMPCVLQVE